jgi:hypothetical protein
MANEQGGQNVDDAGKVSAGDPVATPDIKERSDGRMSKLMGNFIANAPREQTTAGAPDKKNSETEPQSNTPKPSEKKVGEDQPKPPEQIKKPEDAPKPTEKKVEEPPKKEQPAKKLSLDETEKERRAQQARADKAEADLKKYQESESTWKTEREELLKSKELVDQFNANPVEFVNQRLPELGKKLAVAGDPVKMIESEVEQFHSELEKQFKKDLGEDWHYSEAEALKPGTPSFRFRLAITTRTDEASRKAQQYVENQRRVQEEAQRRSVVEKEELRKEYGFTDEDFKEADKILQKEGISFKNLVKLALMDKIIALKLSVIPSVTEPSPDIANTRGASSETPGDDGKPKISAEGRRMLSRLPIGASL